MPVNTIPEVINGDDSLGSRTRLRARSSNGSLAEISEENTEAITDENLCPKCLKPDKRFRNRIQCAECDRSFHVTCVGNLTANQARNIPRWVCAPCRRTDSAIGIMPTPASQAPHQGQPVAPISSERQNENIRWGNATGFEEIRRRIQAAYETVITWELNLFLVPRGRNGKEFIGELTRLLQLFNTRSPWESLGLHLAQVFVPLMLQKPSAKSKPKDHLKYLGNRIDKWRNGDINCLVAEGTAIQERIQKAHSKKAQSDLRNFSRLMLLGEVKKALRYVDEESSIAGVHEVTGDVLTKLEDKHPPAAGPTQHAMLERTHLPVQPVVFESIDGDLVQKCARTMHGSGGPTKVDTEIWKHILCSRVHGDEGIRLADEIANLARRMCREDIPFDHISTLVACRLVPLKKKDNGIRPIGVGETLRRIIGKAVTAVLRNDIQMATGCLQTCSGLESGIEAAIHAMREAFQEEDCEAMLFVDAENAFNKLNRSVALHNVEQVCPPFHRYLANTYKEPAKLYLRNGSYILSQEGVTQGDNAAMAFYALATRPLIDKLQVDNPGIRQVWFADDSAAAGSIQLLRGYWDMIVQGGADYGYHPNPTKSVLVVKNPDNVPTVRHIFQGIDIKITCEGEKHLGAVVGSQDFKESYVRSKVNKWVKDLEKLSLFAADDPQSAFAAYTKGICHRWTYVQRTIPETTALFEPLERCIRSNFLPALVGRQLSDAERRLLALPPRFGGIGIRNPTQTASLEFNASASITNELAGLIRGQTPEIPAGYRERMTEAKRTLLRNRETAMKNEFEDVMQLLPEETGRYMTSAAERGASSWLTALPLKALGYSLNKREFRDSLRLRYGWEIPDLPRSCVCGSRNTIEHTLDCKRGGFVSLRHNDLRDTEARLLDEIAYDVQIEPELQDLSENIQLAPGSNTAQGARLDIAARGVYSRRDRTFFDVRVTNPHCMTNRGKTLPQVYAEHERQKMVAYNDRVLQVERGTFVPLVYTTSGGMSTQCQAFHKKIAEATADKKKEKYSDVAAHIRTVVRFSILRSTLVALRGFRGRGKIQNQTLDEISFNLIPRLESYEGF